jgi:hypothetical protein
MKILRTIETVNRPFRNHLASGAVGGAEISTAERGATPTW